MGLFPYTFESEKPHHIKNIFVMGLDKRSLHNSFKARLNVNCAESLIDITER